MEKQLENPEKKKNSGSFCPPHFPLPLSVQWGQLVGASCFPLRAPLFPLCLGGPFCQALSRCPSRPFSLSLCVSWAFPISSALPAPAVCNTQFVIYNKRVERSFPIFYVCVESTYHHM
jgi:hypothetical protein